MSVRKFLLVALTSLAAVSAQSWEWTSTDTPPEEALAQVASGEALVTSTPVPVPAVVTELANYSPDKAIVRHAKKAKAAKVAQAKAMLSRSAREQFILAGKDSDDTAGFRASDDDDDETGLDDLDLHRSFSRPKVAKTLDQLDEGDNPDAVIDLPEHIKLRLLMARTKAVEALVLAQESKASDTSDEALSDTVKLRLRIARERAVKLHREKFGEA